MTGLVETGRNNIFTVLLDEHKLLCRIRGKRLALEEREYTPLAPGDMVVIGDIDWADRTGVIDKRLPRSNSFSRFNRKRNASQALAANIDRAVCVTSVRQPAFKPRFLDRFLALCEHQRVSPLIVQNKVDLAANSRHLEGAKYRKIGYQVIDVSAKTGFGMDELAHALHGLRTVFVGQSGVGKSSVLNTLSNAVVQRVGTVSDKYHRGRHTTTAGRLICGSRWQIIDTPGIRELDIRLIPTADLAGCFVEFRAVSQTCEHSDCRHVEETNCAVRSSVGATISAERYESYVRLVSELMQIERDKRE